MTMRPPLRERAIVTFVPSDRRRSSSTRSRSASRGAAGRDDLVRAWLAEAADELLGLAGGELTLDHDVRDPRLLVGGQTADRTRVAARQRSVDDVLLDRFVKVEQAERVRDRRSSPTDSRGDVLLGQPELVDQLPEGERLFDRVQVFALEVLDEGELELVAIRRPDG